MAVRFYLPASGAAAVSPAFGALWDLTSSASRRPMSTTPANTALLVNQIIETTATSPLDVLSRQFVGPNDLLAQEYAGTFSLAMVMHQDAAAADEYLQVRISIVSGDGSTVRGELFSGQAFATVSASSSAPNYELHTDSNSANGRTRILSAIALSPVTAQAGDRLVVEIGSRFCNGTTTLYRQYAQYGDLNSATDHALVVDSADTTKRPWIEFDFVTPGISVAPPAMTATAEMHAPTLSFVDTPTHTTPQRRQNTLSVRVGDRHITREVSALTFRKEAIGGGRSMAFRLNRPLDRFDTDVDGLAKCYIYDARSAATIIEGRVTDLGRSAGGDGQQWDIVAFGPAQHATDKSFPYVVITQDLDFRRQSESTKNASTGTDERSDSDPTLLISAEEGKTITTSWIGRMVNRTMRLAGMKLGRIYCEIDAGVADADYKQQLVTAASGGGSTVADTANADTTPGTLSAVVVTDFPNGDDATSIRVVRNTSGDTGAENRWFEFWNVIQRALLVDASGAERTTGYGNNYVLAHEIANDLLGRHLDQYDGANATVSTSGSYQIDQFDYRDGTTAEQILADLMLLEPAFRWYCKPDVTGDGYEFRWEAWPTTVRYEATLDDGGTFPASWNEVYNLVTVRWTDKRGKPRTLDVDSTVARFDDEGITRSTTIDLADELGSSAAATRAGENFLAEHNVPRNAGTLNISRPVRDLTTGRMVEPFEIEPGELIRVRGIESYPDALNADSNDGLTVFRIWAVNYSSDDNTASLELDTDARTVANALRKLSKRRTRKR